MVALISYTLIPHFASFQLTSNSPLPHIYRVNFSSANVITSEVTSLNYATYVTIKGCKLNKLTIKDRNYKIETIK